MLDKQKMLSFLQELEAICTKYDAQIASCGCCWSPWVQGSLEGSDIQFTEESLTVSMYDDETKTSHKVSVPRTKQGCSDENGQK